jgi:hypothetical protein
VVALRALLADENQAWLRMTRAIARHLHSQFSIPNSQFVSVAALRALLADKNPASSRTRAR